MKPYVNLNVEKSIGSIEFFHPQSNSLPSKVLKELAVLCNFETKEDVEFMPDFDIDFDLNFNPEEDK